MLELKDDDALIAIKLRSRTPDLPFLCDKFAK